MFLLYKLPEIAASVLTVILLYILVNNTYKKSDHFHYISLITSGFALVLVSMISDSVIPNSILSILGILMEFCIVKYLYAINLYQVFLTIILFNVWDIISTNLVMNLFLLTGSYSQDSLFTPGTDERLLYLITIYLAQFTGLYFFLKLHQKTVHLSGKKLIIPMVFFISDFLMVFFMHLILQSISSLSAFIVRTCFSLSVLMLITSIIGLVLLDMLYLDQEKEREQQLLKLQLADQQQAFRQMQKQFDSIRIIRHDIKNILLNYRIMLENNQSEKVIQNIGKVLESTFGLSDSDTTDSSLLNALLHETQNKCVSNSIQFKYRVHLSALFENLKFMVLLSNLIDNAYEAECGQPTDKRLILFELVEKEEQISVIIQNYISQSVLMTNPTLKTSKDSSALHGLGLKSVRSVVEERNGMMQIYESENMFTVHVLYPKD